VSTILLGDHDPLVRETLTRAPERIGHRVEPVENGLDGGRAREGGFNLAIVVPRTG